MIFKYQSGYTTLGPEKQMAVSLLLPWQIRFFKAQSFQGRHIANGITPDKYMNFVYYLQKPMVGFIL